MANKQKPNPEVTMTIEQVDEDTNPFDAHQRHAHKTNDELGFAVLDTITGDIRYFKSSGNGPYWVEYIKFSYTDYSDITAHFTDEVPGRINLHRGKVFIVPVKMMPFFGDGSIVELIDE